MNERSMAPHIPLPIPAVFDEKTTWICVDYADEVHTYPVEGPRHSQYNCWCEPEMEKYDCKTVVKHRQTQ